MVRIHFFWNLLNNRVEDVLFEAQCIEGIKDCAASKPVFRTEPVEYQVDHDLKYLIQRHDLFRYFDRVDGPNDFPELSAETIDLFVQIDSACRHDIGDALCIGLNSFDVVSAKAKCFDKNWAFKNESLDAKGRSPSSMTSAAMCAIETCADGPHSLNQRRKARQGSGSWTSSRWSTSPTGARALGGCSKT